MFDKIRLKTKMKKLIKTINEIEKHRYRSQAALVEAILKDESPDDQDVEFFNKYTEQIDTLRIKIREVQQELNKM